MNPGETKSKEVINAVVFEGSEPLGVVQVPMDKVDQIGRALEQGGFAVRPATNPEPDVYEMTQECEPDNPRPCELSIALGRVQMLGREAGISTDQIDALEQRGTVTEAEAQNAVNNVITSMPDGEIKAEAAMWRDVTWGGQNG